MSVSSLEIDGKTYEVIKYREEKERDSFSIHAVLRLSEDQIIEMHKAMERSPEKVAVRRIGVDDDVLHLRTGGQIFWSRHEENGEIVYKQIVRYYPPPPPAPVEWPGTVELDNVINLLVDVTLRFESMVEHLAEKGVIAADEKTKLLKSRVMELAGSNRIEELLSQISRVKDADLYL